MKKGNVNKWDLPGWKFEPAYSSRTLVGDWFEERNMVSKNVQWKSYTHQYLKRKQLEKINQL